MKVCIVSLPQVVTVPEVDVEQAVNLLIITIPGPPAAASEAAPGTGAGWLGCALLPPPPPPPVFVPPAVAFESEGVQAPPSPPPPAPPAPPPGA